MHKLNNIKQSMQDTRVIFGGYELTIWEFAGRQLSIHDAVNLLAI